MGTRMVPASLLRENEASLKRRSHRIRIRQKGKEKEMSSLLVGGIDRIECRTTHYSQDDLKKGRVEELILGEMDALEK